MNIFIEIVLLTIIALPTYWISAVVHELGHIIVGLANGWKMSLLVVGPMGIKREEDKLSLYFEKNIILWGGIGGVFPTKNDVNNVKVWSKVLLGGPIASILMGIVFCIIWFFHSNFFLLLLGLMPLSMGIGCLLPVKTGISYADGERWRRLRDGGKGEAEEIALLRMLEFEQSGKDESLMQKTDFEALLDADYPVHRYLGHYYLYRYYATQNETDKKIETLDILNNLKKDVPKVVIESYKL